MFKQLKTNIPQKIQTGGLMIYFYENPPGIFHFFTLPMEIPDKTKLYPWKFLKIVLDLLEIPRQKTKTPGNFTCYLFDNPGNSISSTPLLGFFPE